MKVKMLISMRGSRDGVFAEMFEAGSEYDLGATEKSRDLAAVFLREGWAAEVKAEAAAGADTKPDSADSDGESTADAAAGASAQQTDEAAGASADPQGAGKAKGKRSA